MEQGQLKSGWIATKVVATQDPALGNDCPEDSRDCVTRLDPGSRVRIAGDEALHRSVALIEDTERDVRRATQAARGDAHVLKDRVGAAIGRELQPDIDERSQPRVG